MSPQERLFLLDGMALVYRAYFSFITRPLVNSKGQNTGAIYGFVTTLMKILEDHRPDHVAVVFDTPEPTFRHKRYPQYKATRQETPEDLISQLEPLKAIVRAFRVPLIELPGYEADDVIGTLARRAEQEGVATVMVTPDKDYMQLVTDLTSIYRPGRTGPEMEIVEEPGVREKFGVGPGQVIDVLALIGDKSDNIPGVPGVGEKTAIPLIQKYGSLQNLYDHIEEIPQKGLREKLTTHRDLAFLSRDLVTIDTAAPVRIDFHELRAAERNTAELLHLFDDLEIRSLANRLRNMPAAAPPAERPAAPTGPREPASAPVLETPITTILDDRHEYRCVTTEADLIHLAGVLADAKEFVVDTETTSTDPMGASLVGLAFCVEPRKAFYVPVQPSPEAAAEGLFGSEEDRGPAGFPLDAVRKTFRPVLENGLIRKIGQNIKYDVLVLRNHGMALRGIAHDTMVASYILRADGQHNLDALALEAFRYRMVSFEDLVGKGKQQIPITRVPLQALADYSAEDADFTMRIYQHQLPRLGEMGLLRLCREVEFPLLPVLVEMEFAGITLDADYLGSMSKDLEGLLQSLVQKILEMAGETFNINSTQQLGRILFEKLQLQKGRKTKTGYSTDAAVLEELRGAHPIIGLLLEYRQLTKLKSTYIDALPLLIHPRTGRVHTSFNQAVASTGRLSSSDPNLQNIPIRTEIGRAIRKAFVARSPDHVILSADYSQIELRVMAHMSGDPGLIEAFQRDEDIHTTTAASVFGVPAGEVSRDMRRKAKEVNFGIMYGIGPFGLANRLEIGQGEARDIIARYFERFPKVKQYIQDTIESARRQGYVSTMLGRRRYLADITSRNQAVRGNAERAAINMPIQGTAADMIKLAMIRIQAAIEANRLRSRMLLQVHDELVFEVPREEEAAFRPQVVNAMQESLRLNVPVKVDVGIGQNWMDAH